MVFLQCQHKKRKIWVATCWPPVSGIRSVCVPINFYHGGLSLVQRGAPTDFPILRFLRGGHMTPPLSLRCMGQTYPYEGLSALFTRLFCSHLKETYQTKTALSLGFIAHNLSTTCWSISMLQSILFEPRERAKWKFPVAEVACWYFAFLVEVRHYWL